MSLTLVLASGSPRRRELLEQLGLNPVIRPSNIDESRDNDESPLQYVHRIAIDKVGKPLPNEVVIAADTIVALGDKTLGKPGSDADAVAMLGELSGRTHLVHTGVAACRGDRLLSTVITTSVKFASITSLQIAWYVATGEPQDKAGAYGIQGAGGLFVDEIDGSYTNVVGLPLAQTFRLLADLEVDMIALSRNNADEMR
jgi:septum formation protein